MIRESLLEIIILNFSDKVAHVFVIYYSIYNKNNHVSYSQKGTDLRLLGRVVRYLRKRGWCTSHLGRGVGELLGDTRLTDDRLHTRYLDT